MNKARWVSATAGAAMIAATLVLPAAGVAYASGNGNVTGNGNVGLLSGNTIDAPISVPVNLCGVSLGIIGFGNSGCQGGASSNVSTPSGGNGGGGNGGTNGNGNVVGNGNIGVGSGNTITAPISAPVNVCAVSGSVGGYTNSDCQGGAHSNTTLGNGGGNGGGGNGGTNGNGNVTGIGNVSALAGNTITAPISAPVNLCSISLALLGFGNSGCQGGATTNVTTAQQGSNGNVTGIGNVGVGSGNTVNAPISVPVNVCSVSLGVLGFANSGCQGGAVVNPPVQPNPQCRGLDCNPGCQGADCNPGCHGADCNPSCHGADCNPPGNCQHNCTPGNNGNPNGGNPNGTQTTTVTNATAPVSGGLPTTGADLLLLGVAAIGTVGVGAGAITLTRRRRNSTVS